MVVVVAAAVAVRHTACPIERGLMLRLIAGGGGLGTWGLGRGGKEVESALLVRACLRSGLETVGECSCLLPSSLPLFHSIHLKCPRSCRISERQVPVVPWWCGAMLEWREGERVRGREGGRGGGRVVYERHGGTRLIRAQRDGTQRLQWLRFCSTHIAPIEDRGHGGRGASTC